MRVIGFERLGERRRLSLRDGRRAGGTVGELGSDLAAGRLHGAAAHRRLAGGRGRAGRPDRRWSAAMDGDALDAELGADDLREHRVQPLAELDRGGVDLGDRPVGARAQRHGRLGRVVEALAVGDVLEADREADAARERLAAPAFPEPPG